MMTQVLVLFESGQFELTQTDVPPETLVRQMLSGEWPLPELYAPAHLKTLNGAPLLRILRQGNLVVVAPAQLERAGRPVLVRAGLPARHRRILAMLAEGQTLKQIQARMGLRARLLQKELAELKDVLGAKTLAHTVGRATELLLLGTDDGQVDTPDD